MQYDLWAIKPKIFYFQLFLKYENKKTNDDSFGNTFCRKFPILKLILLHALSLSLSLSLFQTLFLCTSKHTMNTPPHTHLSIYPFTSRYDTLSITLSGTNFIPTSLLTSIISLTKKLTLSHTHSQLTSTQSISLYALLDRRQRIKAFDKVSQCRSMYLGRSWHLWQKFQKQNFGFEKCKTI